MLFADIRLAGLRGICPSRAQILIDFSCLMR